MEKTDWFDKIAEDEYWGQTNHESFSFDEPDETGKQLAPTSNAPKVFSSKPNAESTPKKSSGISSSLVQNAVKIPLANEEIKRYHISVSDGKIGTSLTLNGSSKPIDLVKKVLSGEHHYCYFLKSKESKLLLLDKAIESYDGDAITSAVLYLEQTMSKKLFNYELGKRQLAVDHYVCYLQSMGPSRQNELVDFLTMLGNYEDAAMLNLKQSLNTSNVTTKLKNLRSCNQNYFSGFVGQGFGEIFDFWASQIQDYMCLLERQLPIAEADFKKGVQPASQTGEKQSPVLLVDGTVTDTLAYCLANHYNVPENLLASPTALKNVHRLNDKQYAWTALVSFAKDKHWDRIDGLFEGRGWLGGKKVKSTLKFYNVARTLQKFAAPRELLIKYGKLIEDEEERAAFARDSDIPEILSESSRIGRR
ncbi:Spermatogenesis-defective protein 39 -like protein [Halotydeus destructor]|nr:Spermatogenesis-defective protein 39 -like protein [Halotydeus destructor]